MLSHTHSKRHLIVGHPASLIRPAWKQSSSTSSKNKQQEDRGSKILLSRLPTDVGENEIEELFKKTVGPLKESFLIYNSQGRSKGMAVVSFQRQGDAATARTKYNGKIIDGRRPIKIEVVVDADSAPTAPSLSSRLGIIAQTTQNGVSPPKRPKVLPVASGPIPSNKPKPRLIPRRRGRQRKGPRLVKKSLAQLDKDIEEYQAAADLVVFGRG